MTKTSIVKKEEVKNDWYLVDATGVRLGRLTSTIAKILQGKNKASYSPCIDCGDQVIVINSKDIDFHPSRKEGKIYWRHSGYPGGLRKISLGELIKKDPNEVIKKAVWGMMPKTKLGRVMMRKLYIYEGKDHKHEAQKPKLIDIK